MGVVEAMVPVSSGGSVWTARQGVGAGPALVLSHGGAGLWDVMGPVADAVDDLVEVVRYDQRGCGRSAASSGGPYSVADHVADLEALRRHFGFQSWIVGGHSWGATLALAYAWTHPDRVRGVLYVSGTGAGQGWRAAFRAEAGRRRGEAGAARLAALSDRDRTPEEEREYRRLHWVPDFADPAQGEALCDAVDAPHPVNVDSNRAVNEELKGWDEGWVLDRCRTVTAPVLLVHGAGDPRPPWAVDSMAAALPDAEVAVLDRSGHFPWLEQPAEFAEAVRGFLARVSGQGHIEAAALK